MALEPEPELEQVEEQPNLLDQLDQDVTKKKYEYSGEVHTTLFRDPQNPTGLPYPIVPKHSPNVIVKNMLTHNEIAGYTGCLVVGASGTGKTTWVRQLVHRLHTNSKISYTPIWFSKDEIQELGTIIKELPKGVNYILVFDDASYALEDLPKEKLNELAQTLTVVRHIVKGKVITIINIHYDKAVKKFFRAVPFRFLTSISIDELGQYEDLFGSRAKWKLRDFAYHYHTMMTEKQWSFELSAWNKKYLTYQVHKPFRLGLASEVNDMHYFVYCRESCSTCDPDLKEKNIISTEDFTNDLIKSYGLKDVRATLATYAYTHKGIKTFPTRKQALWNRISELDKNNSIDWKDVMDILRRLSLYKRKRSYIWKNPEPNIGDLINTDFRL